MFHLFRNIWLVKIFDKEFGFSDLLSNYSRAYAWMANQLGHLTLGLGFALALMWSSVTVAAAYNVMRTLFPDVGDVYALFANWQVPVAGTDATSFFGNVVAFGIAGAAILFLCADGRFAVFGVIGVVISGSLSVWSDPAVARIIDWEWVEGYVPHASSR